MQLRFISLCIALMACRSGKVDLIEDDPVEPSGEASSEDTGSDDTAVDDSGSLDSGEEDSGDEPDSNDIDDDGDGFTENEGDCDDDNADINPDAFDWPGDGIDADGLPDYMSEDSLTLNVYTPSQPGPMPGTRACL